jgi:putative DNA-invertase from lambdoid prophage Rac
MHKVAIYARVSTIDQNCEMQLTDLRTYAKARGWAVFGEYVDTGWSGAKASRPELDRLMKDARMRKVDCILVWKLDRWGRSVSNLLASLEELKGLGVRWISVTQNMDTDETNPAAKLLMHMLAAVAEFERSMIQERVKAGMKAAKHRGAKFGRPKAVFDRVKAREMRQSGASLRDIATAFGVGVGTVHRLISV